MMLIQKLYDCGLIKDELWSYLTIRDITCLMEANKDIRDMSLRINEVAPQVIFLDLNNRSEESREKIIRNMVFNFPNISKLTLYLYPYHSTIKISKSLRKLYNCDLVCRSLQDLTVCIGSDEGVVEGISFLRNLKYLNISNSLITSDVISEIGSMMSITSLDCSSCQNIGDNGLFQISKLLNLKSLNLSSIEVIKDSGLSYLSCLTNITLLDLTGSEITTLSPISSLTSMIILDLTYCCYLTHEGFSFVSSLINLKSLNISLSEISILSPISSLTAITSLDINHCYMLTDEGFSFVSSLINMTSLNISYCYGITTLFPISSLTNLTLLNLSGCKDLANEELSFISSLINLTDLNICRCYEISNYGLSFLTSLVKIIKLNIGNCNILDFELDQISRLTNIQILKMTLRNEMTNEGFNYLLKLKHLNEISFIIDDEDGEDSDDDDDDNDKVFDDINLSTFVIEMFVNIKEFKCCFDNISPVNRVKGFLHVEELRKKKRIKQLINKN